jgi:hypothetical protein
VLCEEDVVALMFLFVVKNELATSTKNYKGKSYLFVYAELFFKNFVVFIQIKLLIFLTN